MNVYKDMIVMFGGERQTRAKTRALASRVFLNDILIFKTANHSWESLKVRNKPPERRNHTSVIHENRLFVHGGIYDLGRCLSDFWVFDLVAGVW